MIEKAEILRALIQQVNRELAGLVTSARAAHEAATHEETRAEDRHDTFAIEASYLAAGQSSRILELENLKAELEGYLSGSPREDRVRPGCLVRYDSEEGSHLFLMTKSGGGLKILFEGNPLQTLSTASPLGKEFSGLCEGEEFEVELRGDPRIFRIRSIS
jgi:transcription elongation GreA/GreB family factor